jgi:3-oxoacyl-[acyl-carrier-protein] synthase III
LKKVQEKMIMEEIENIKSTSFFERQDVKNEIIPVADGIPFGIESVTNSALGMGGAYAAWGESYNNSELSQFVEHRIGEPLVDTETMHLDELGFLSRHHIPDLSEADHIELELEVGSRLLKQAAQANGWDPAEVQGVLLGMTAPVTTDYVAQIARRAGISEDALKVSVHKACDGSVGALQLALNPGLAEPGQMNVAGELAGKKVLVGGIEGLSRFTSHARDKHALQLFGNGAGVIGVVPGENMKFLAGKTAENYDEEGLLQVRMYYPHSREMAPGKSLLEVTQDSSGLHIAGMMHEPVDGLPVVMAGLMGMVKLFVRSGVDVVTEVFNEYSALMSKLDIQKTIDLGIVHHANYKINLLKAKQLLKAGIEYPMPWLLNDFGNVSAASCMIAFLRRLQSIKPGDHLLFDGFGAGTYYDVMAVAMG